MIPVTQSIGAIPQADAAISENRTSSADGALQFLRILDGLNGKQAGDAGQVLESGPPDAELDEIGSDIASPPGDVSDDSTNLADDLEPQPVIGTAAPTPTQSPNALPEAGDANRKIAAAEALRASAANETPETLGAATAGKAPRAEPLFGVEQARQGAPNMGSDQAQDADGTASVTHSSKRSDQSKQDPNLPGLQIAQKADVSGERAARSGIASSDQLLSGEKHRAWNQVGLDQSKRVNGADQQSEVPTSQQISLDRTVKATSPAVTTFTALPQPSLGPQADHPSFTDWSKIDGLEISSFSPLSETSRADTMRPVPIADLPNAVLTKLREMLTGTPAPPPGRTEITLSPAELGRVTFIVGHEDGVMSLQVLVERPETLEIIRRHADILQRTAADGPIRLTFEQQDAAEGGQGYRSENQQEGDTAPGTADESNTQAMPLKPNGETRLLDLKL